MNSKRILKKGEKIVSIDESSIDLQKKEFTEHVSKFNFDILEGEEKEISLDGIKIKIGNLNFTEEIELDVKYDRPFLMINFELEGDSAYNPINEIQKSIPFFMKSNQYNFFYMPEIEGTITYYTKKRKYFSMLFSEEYIKTIFKKNFAEVSTHFGKALEDKTPFLMFNESQPIPYKLLEIINEIVNCCFLKEIKEVYIQSKTVEIFSYLFTKLNAKTNKIKLNDRDLELVKKTEKIIIKNISMNVTLDEISQQIGTNKFKLNKDFKLVNGESIATYQSRLRMQKAKEMLKNINLTISEVSDAVGYKNPQHFTVAFKKEFNCLPSFFRKDFHY